MSKLRGADISGSIYAVNSKNSTGPILLIGIFCSLYVFDKRNALNILINIVVTSLLVIIIALMKCRTVLISLPFIFCAFVHFAFKSKVIKFLIASLAITFILVVVFVPSINQIIVHDILFNGKTTIDDIFSGRISQTINGFANMKPVLGTGSSYIDCMPLSFLLTYGIVGFLLLLPFSIIPIVSLISSCDKKNNKNKTLMIVSLLILFFFEYLFEGFGYFGPGAKSFFFWLFAGFEGHHLFNESKSRLFQKIDSFSSTSAYKVKPVHFTSAIGVIIMVATLLSFPPKFFSSRISGAIYNKMPSSAVITDYIEPKDISLIRNVDKMCVGQRIKFSFESNNQDSDDKVIGRIFEGNTNLVIDKSTNVVTAVSKAPPLSYFLYSYIRDNYIYNCYITVYSPNEYAFDKLHISTNSFAESFQYCEDEMINIGEGAYQQAFYDNYYVPQGVDVSYHSSDPSIVTIDSKSGVFFGVSKGSCYLYASITNLAGEFESLNKINVNVIEDSSFVNCTSLSLDYQEKCYRYIPFEIRPVFNENASDTSISYEISGVNYKVSEDNKIIFLDSGIASITVKSISNPKLYETFQINVIDNKPVSFSCSNKIIQVGKIYRPTDLGLFLNFSSGHSLLVTDDILSVDNSDLSGRAWHETNGMIIDHCSIKTVKTGYASLSLRCLYDDSISDTFSFEVIKYSREQYDKIINSISMLLITMLSIISFISICLINFRRRYYKSIIMGVASLLYLSFSFVFIGSGIFTIIFSSVIMFLAAMLVLLNQLLFKDDWPRILTEEVPDVYNDNNHK